MDLTIVSSDQTLNYSGIVDIVANTTEGQQHIATASGNVNRIKRGKIQLLFKKKGSESLETLEFYVDDGISYIENKTINVVANIRNESTS